MAITTMDQLVAALAAAPERMVKAAFTGEAAGSFHSSLYLAGRPGAGVAPSPGVNGVALAGTGLTSPGYAGQIPFPAGVAGKSIYVGRFSAAQAAAVGQIILADRLWHNSGLDPTVTTAQAFTTPAFPARDADGATSGRGLSLGLEVSTATTNAGVVTTITASYTSSSGVAGRTATIPSFPATAVAGTIVPFALQAGDIGVQSVQSVTLGTTLGGGAIHLVAYREIVDAAPPVAGVPDRQDAITAGMPSMYPGSVPWLIYLLTGTGGGVVSAMVQWAQG